MENARSLRDTIELLLRHRVLIAAVSCCAVVLATTIAMFQTRIYESNAVLLIKFGREMFSQIGDRETLVNRENAIINVEIQILRSEAVVEGTIEAMTVERLYPGLYENPPEGVPIDRVAASKFRRNFIVRAVPASDVLKVAFRHPDPEVAAETVNVLVDEFKRAHLIAFGQEKTTAFLHEQVEAYRAALEQKEEKVQQFRAAHPAFTVQDPGALLMDERTRLTSELDETREQIAAIRRRLATPSPVDTAERRSDRSELRARLADQTRLAAELESTEAELGNLAGLQKEYRQLLRERDETEDLYRTYHKQLADARISNEMDRQQIANISVIQEGRVPLTPIRPQKMLYVAVGGTIGLVLGCLAAFLLESLRVVPATTVPETSDRSSPLRLRRS